MKTKAEIVAALRLANSAPFTPVRASGCGRAYVCLAHIQGKGSRTILDDFEAACKEVGLLFTRKTYGAGNNVIYIGYDNCDGKALGKSLAVADALNAAGIPCYQDAAQD